MGFSIHLTLLTVLNSNRRNSQDVPYSGQQKPWYPVCYANLWLSDLTSIAEVVSIIDQIETLELREGLGLSPIRVKQRVL